MLGQFQINFKNFIFPQNISSPGSKGGNSPLTALEIGAYDPLIRKGQLLGTQNSLIAPK